MKLWDGRSQREMDPGIAEAADRIHHDLGCKPEGKPGRECARCRADARSIVDAYFRGGGGG